MIVKTPFRPSKKGPSVKRLEKQAQLHHSLLRTQLHQQCFFFSVLTKQKQKQKQNSWAGGGKGGQEILLHFFPLWGLGELTKMK